MNARRRFFIPIFVIGIALFMLTNCNLQGEADKPTVVASITPVGDWVRQVAGDALHVAVIVPPSASPHTFELRPQQLREAVRARLVVFMGAGLEYWDDELLANLNDRVRVLRLSEGQKLIQSDDGHDHSHGAGNPHLWLDPVFAQQAVRAIADELSALFPDKDTLFSRRADAYIDSLRRLDADIQRTAKKWRSRRFVGDHSSWVYFARRYGLTQTGVIEATPGREISARDMSRLIRTMARKRVRAIFADRRKSTQAPETLAEATGAKVAMLDPIGGGQMQETYLEMMRENLREMNRVLR
ncbi:MAG: zinc ABC transporter substrate-binding protein [Bacteroidetes bacterium]|nr:zinc ABC transporter substrate-binding protein [Bacteroidota bacterium]